MTTTHFDARLLDQYLGELLGTEQLKDPLLLKNLSQKVKFHLRKLSDEFRKEHTAILKALQDLYKEYAVDVPIEGEGGKTKKQIPQDKMEEFQKRAGELENMTIEISHYPFEEKDFIDVKTGDVVASDIYYNLIDKLVYEKLEIAV